tara:strand:+ start:1258 stop:2052 length:795 start_codon:yes stop_codon:yes gene_type:complete
MEDKYKILKLKSGEELIAAIVGSTKGKMILDRPMVFKTSFHLDGTGRKRELTFLRDWLQNTTDIRVEIPRDHIATFLHPSSEVLKLYHLEKERDDVGSLKDIPQDESVTDGTMKNLFDDLKELEKPSVMDIIDDIIKNGGGPNSEENKETPSDQSLKDLIQSLEDHKDGFDVDPMMEDLASQDFIVMNMMFPPKLLQDLIDKGIIDGGELGSIMDSYNDDNEEDEDDMHPEGLSEDYTGDEEDREDFGNKWSDWSSDMDDYFTE